MARIRYKYRKEREGFQLKKVSCPVCGSNHINWIKVVEHTSWSGEVGLLAECWSGDTSQDKPRHLFLIKLKDLPVVEIENVGKNQKKKVKRRKTTSKSIRR